MSKKNKTEKPAPCDGDAIYWGIPNFSRKLKNEFIGECKKQGRSFRPLLANLLKSWLYDQQKAAGEK